MYAKMLHNIFANALECWTHATLLHREVDGSKVFLQMFCKCFILHVTTSYLQHVFNMLKHFQNIYKNVLEPSTSHGYAMDVKYKHVSLYM